MRPLCAACCLLATLSGVHARGADASRPHTHSGQLAKYTAQAPSAYGLSVEGVPLEKLRSGKPVLRMTSVAGGFKRSVSIQDVNAPPSVVWGRIMDLPKYPKMVEGCVECEPYRTEKGSGGAQVVYSRYKIRAAGLTMEYFMKHIYEPKKHCMTFHVSSRVSHARAILILAHSCSFPASHCLRSWTIRGAATYRIAWATGTWRIEVTAGAACTTRRTRSCRGSSPASQKT